MVPGRVEDIALRADRKLGGMARFGKSARAQEYRQDMEDGVLTDISIGYRVDDWVEEKRDGETYYRVTRWTPMEVSIVSVPADHTVGAGRSADRGPYPEDESEAPKNAPTGDKEQRMAEQEKPAAPTGRTASDEVVNRSDDAKVIASWGKAMGMSDIAADAIAAGKSADEFRAIAEAESVKRSQATTQAGHVDASEKEQRAYSPANAIRSIIDNTWGRENSVEFEVSKEIAGKMGKEVAGNRFFLPLNFKTRASVTGQAVGTASLGGSAVPTIQMPMIELLRNKPIVARAGARFLSGLTAPVKFPRQITANSAVWVGENPTAASSLSSLTFDTVTLAPKTLDAHTAFSRQLAFQMSPDAQAFITDDILRVIALALDSAAINGTGSSNQPTGIRNDSSVSETTLGANAGTLDWDDLVGMETTMANDNADYGSVSYVTNSKVRGKLKTTLQLSTATAPGYLWGGGNDPGTINGYNAYVSNQVPSNLTKGTSTTICSSIILGNWDECLVGEFGGAVEVLVDPYTYALQNMIALHAYAWMDVAVRHGESFVFIDDVLTT